MNGWSKSPPCPRCGVGSPHLGCGCPDNAAVGLEIPRWRVLRHGGRRTDVERVLYAGNDEAQAEKVFRWMATTMRQGSVRLIDTTGIPNRGRPDHTVEICWAPRVRTRW